MTASTKDIMAIPRDPGTALLRRGLPAVLAVTVLTGWLRWWAYEHGLIGHTLGVVLMTTFAAVIFTGISIWSARRLREATRAYRRREHDALYRTVARNYPGGAVLLFDRDLRYLLVEGDNLEAVGLRAEELEGKTIHEALEPDVSAAVEPMYRAALAGETSRFEMGFRGHEYMVTVAPTRDDDGEISGGLVQTQQVTEQKQLEEQLRQAQRLDAVGQLAGGVAHDFNNLLTVISGYADIALGKLPPDEPAREPLHEIERAANAAADLTRQLLAFSRKQRLQPQHVDMNDVVNGVVPMLSRLIEARVGLVVALADDLPVVLADRGQLEQVLVNLVVNARDAIADSGTITIETAETELDEAYARVHLDAQVGAHVMLSVTDTGAGMDQATQERIFEPFFTTKALGEGTGLGLATVHGIVKQSGGNIWIYSELGRGTTFKVYLPVADDQTASEPEAVDDLPSRPSRRTATVLVVEDNAAVRALTTEVLEEAGYTVLAASAAADALVILSEQPVDVVLTDVVMPGGSGRSLGRARDARDRTPPIIYMSGYTAETISPGELTASETPLLEKPFTSNALLNAVAQALESR